MRIAAFAVAVLMASQAQAGSCVTAIIRDINGLEIKTDQPLVGFIIPDHGPVVDYPIPQGAHVETGVETECPAALVAQMQELFDQNCITTEGRAKAATSNEQTAEAINKRCQDLYQALKKN